MKPENNSPASTAQKRPAFRRWSIVAFCCAGVVVGLSICAIVNRQFVFDQFTVWTYRPSSNVQTLTAQAGLTTEGRFIFYATTPEVADQTTFNKECPRQEVGNPILGCYTADGRIYIYNLTNSQLEGVEQVTVTHEMLHAVWQRQSAAEQSRIGTLLNEVYNATNNTELKNRMSYYERAEPGEFTNELHSILGTEVSTLSPELESYYAKYFDRSKVLAWHEKYNSVYTALYTQSDDLASKLKTLGSSIETRSSQYSKDMTQLSSDIAAFNSKATNGGFSSNAEFTAERSALVDRSNTLESQRTAINTDITTYNKYYDQYQAIGLQLQSLNDSIDSFKTLQAAPSV